MTAERFTRRWVRVYTRGLSEETRATRLGEIDSDLHEHRTTGAHGAAIVGRTLRGVPADVTWRREERRTVEATSGRLSGVRALWAAATESWFTPLAVVLGLFNLFGATLVLFSVDGSNGSGRVIGPIILVSLAAAMFAGLGLRWRAGRPVTTSDEHAPEARPGSRIALGALAALAIVALIIGAMTSLFVLAAGVLTLGAVAVIAARRRSSSGRAARTRKPRSEHIVLADVLVIAGSLPGLALWWMIIPGVLALLVIGGVVGTGPGTRRRAAY
jgi:hypothetical protein